MNANQVVGLQLQREAATRAPHNVTKEQHAPSCNQYHVPTDPCVHVTASPVRVERTGNLLVEHPVKEQQK